MTPKEKTSGLRKLGSQQWLWKSARKYLGQEWESANASSTKVFCKNVMDPRCRKCRNIHTHRIHGAGIYANIWGILMVNVTIYIVYMDPMGYWKLSVSGNWVDSFSMFYKVFFCFLLDLHRICIEKNGILQPSSSTYNHMPWRPEHFWCPLCLKAGGSDRIGGGPWDAFVFLPDIETNILNLAVLGHVIYTWIIESVFHDLRTSSTVQSFMRLCAVLVCQIHRHLLSWAHTPNRSVHAHRTDRLVNRSVHFEPTWPWIFVVPEFLARPKTYHPIKIQSNHLYGMQNSHMESLGTGTITLDDALNRERMSEKPLAFWWVLSHPQVALNIWVSFAMVYNRRYHTILFFWQGKRIMNQWIQTLLPIFWGFSHNFLTN